MPKSMVRLSAGRDSMNDQMQALCFFAGANSIFYGEELLTTKNAGVNHCLLYTSPSPRDYAASRMPSSA